MLFPLPISKPYSCRYSNSLHSGQTLNSRRSSPAFRHKTMPRHRRSLPHISKLRWKRSSREHPRMMRKS
ncbi:hypothetical protein YH65_07965 [Sulfurovum lithotrophicum]|uniref:Uncharacterized protein n=1 Tax=Sulfurovum lithotrophicum TaxID=206403 RepID=A0A7U4RQX5_9BACT|nr:hypothetical protein YH65_07965 [Sulfurovum lithotrophicum]